MIELGLGRQERGTNTLYMVQNDGYILGQRFNVDGAETFVRFCRRPAVRKADRQTSRQTSRRALLRQA